MTDKSRISERFGQQVAEAAGEAASEVRQRAGQAMDTACNVAGSAKQMAQQGASQLQDTATQYYRQGRSTAEALWKTLESEIEHRPLRAVLVAASCGLLLGAFLIRRR